MRIAVVGAGIVGLAVTYELVKAGQQVDCFEAVGIMQGRSCGDTRIFRLAHDRPALVDWAHQAHRAWQEWSAAAGVPLVGNQGTVVSGDIEAIAASMAEASAPFKVMDGAPTLPAEAAAGPFLYDPLGGVIQAAATGRFLATAVAGRIALRTIVEIRIHGEEAVLSATDGWQGTYDSVVVAAGAGTPSLVAALGIDMPTRLVHHVRMTFPLRDVSLTPPCWLDRSEAWRPGFRSYGQLAAPGQWAVGGHLPDEDTDWSLSRDEAVERADRTLIEYIAEYVTNCEPQVVDVIYCNVTTGLGDGVSLRRVEPVLVVWGENLFKFAPLLGRALATAASEGSLPGTLAAVAGSGCPPCRI